MKANLRNEKFFLRLVEEGQLKITRCGRAYNLNTGNEIAKSNGSSYRKLSWPNSKSKKIVQVQLHRIVWAVFKGLPTSADLEVNHKDGHKPNCRLKNLELCTPSQNVQHANKSGLSYHLQGDERPNAVFSDDQVSRYRRMVANGKTTIASIARKHQCSITAVSYMIRRKTYTHV